MKGFFIMITFLTRIPIRYSCEYNEDDFIKGIKYVPLVGLIIGVSLFVVSLMHNYIDKPVVSLIVFIFYLWITGGLHIDGMADTADGIFSGRNKEKILEIMKDSRIGTFGVMFIFIHFVSFIILIYFIDFKYLILLPVIGRSCAILSASMSNYPRKDGFGKSFIESSGILEGIIGILFPIIIAIMLYKINLVILLSIFITFIFTIRVSQYIKKIINGLTGDNIGFIIEISQIIFMFSIYFLQKVVI